MEIIEKTIFISYRRTNVPWALAIMQNLTHKGYDVFFDFTSINSGDFEQIITENIRARAHFLILLTPSSLERCDEPYDWFRREMELAIKFQRNIIPILLEGFDFGAQTTLDYLTGNLENIRNYQGLNLYAEYFDAGMDRLSNNFLNIPLDRVLRPKLHSITPKIQQIVNDQKRTIANQAPVEEKILSAQEWFERAFKSNIPKEEIRLYSKAIELDPNFAFAYNNRGLSYDNLGQYKMAINDFDQAIKLNPEDADFHYNRGISYFKSEQIEEATNDFNQAIKLNPQNALFYSGRGTKYSISGQYEKAIDDYTMAIKLNPEDASFYSNRGNSFFLLEKYEKAIADYTHAIRLDPNDPFLFLNRANFFSKSGQYEKAIKDYTQAIQLNSEDTDFYFNRGINYANLGQNEKAISDFDQAIMLDSGNSEAFYNKACLYSLQNNIEEALSNLRKTLIINSQKYIELAKSDSNFDNIRENEKLQKLLEEFSKAK